MATRINFGRHISWYLGGFGLVGAVLLLSGASLSRLFGNDLWQNLAHLQTVDAFLMMTGASDHVHFSLLIIGGIGLLTLLTIAFVTPLALGFFVLDIHMELKDVCDLNGNVTHTRRRLFCKLRRPLPEDAPTRFITYPSA